MLQRPRAEDFSHAASEFLQGRQPRLLRIHQLGITDESDGRRVTGILVSGGRAADRSRAGTGDANAEYIASHILNAAHETHSARQEDTGPELAEVGLAPIAHVLQYLTGAQMHHFVEQ